MPKRRTVSERQQVKSGVVAAASFVPPVPHWPHIVRTYQVIRRKLIEGRTRNLDKALLLAACDYWIARLNEDKTAIGLDREFTHYR